MTAKELKKYIDSDITHIDIESANGDTKYTIALHLYDIADIESDGEKVTLRLQEIE